MRNNNSCALQKWLQRTLCVAFFMGLFAGLFQTSVNNTGDVDVINAYWGILKTAGCILLACSANVLKTLVAKLMSNHFYRDSYFDKMQDALCKVLTLQFLYKRFSKVQCTFQVPSIHRLA